MQFELCPSMMCARIGELNREIRLLEDAGADIFHMDIMDGQYVRNFAMGYREIKHICDKSTIRTEVHLMIEHPEDYIRMFQECGVDIIYIHPDSEYHPITTLQKIQEMGLQSGIVINPGVAVDSLLELYNVVDRVMVMGVNPGHAGQVYLPYVEKKICRLIVLQREYGFSIGMDGAVNLERVKTLSKMGVTHFVLGTAALFRDDYNYSARMKEFRDIL